MTMPIAVSGNVHLLAVRYNQNGQESVTVLAGRSAGSTALDQTSVDFWIKTWWQAVRPVTASSTQLTGGTYRHPATQTVLEAGLGTVGSTLGDSSATPLPAGVGAVIKWKTALGGRSGKGRTFLVGTPSSYLSTDSRALTGGAITLINTAISAYISGLAGVAAQAAVYSRELGTANVITSGAPATVMGVQRRRMR